MPFIDTSDLKVTERLPGWKGRSFDSQNMTFAHFVFEPGAWIHEHAHANEEVWNVVDGELEVTIGSDVLLAGPGFVAVVPPNTAHSVKAITGGRAIVVDHPIRRDSADRAAIGIDFDTPVALPQDTAPISIPFTIWNRFQTAGSVKLFTIESKIASTLPPPTTTQVPAGELATYRVIQAGERYATTIEHSGFAQRDLDEVREGAAVFYVHGVIVYESVPGKRFHTTFCRVYDRNALNGGGGFVPPDRPGYNYGT
jgi:quercetin dioxygenase-like cupin family protein